MSRGIVRRRGGQAYRDASIRTLGRPKEARFALRSLIASPRDNLMGNLRRWSIRVPGARRLPPTEKAGVQEVARSHSPTGRRRPYVEPGQSPAVDRLGAAGTQDEATSSQVAPRDRHFELRNDGEARTAV